jgi:hypothetical protein
MGADIYQWCEIRCKQCDALRKTRVFESHTDEDNVQYYGVEDLTPCRICGDEDWEMVG